MKNTINVFVIMISLFVSTIARAQNEGGVEALKMQGKWTASCPQEFVNKATFNHCSLCAFVIKPSDKSYASIKDFEMDFTADSITFYKDGAYKTIAYTQTKENLSFSFKLNDKHYNFRVFLYGRNQRILEDNDGLIVVLEKVK